MKANLGVVVLVAVVSSLATAGALELWRGRPRLAATEVAPEIQAPESAPPREPLQASSRPVAALQAPDWTPRLDELERRIAALELGATTRRAPVEGDVAPRDDDLRDLVLDWVAEERGARQRAAEEEEEEAVRSELEFDARYRARELALAHDLPQWQETKMADLFLEVALRDREIRAAIDLATADPEEVERRWEEFDEWADRRYQEELGADLVAEVFEDE